MWLFLSRRLRMWVLLAIGLPLVRFGLRKIAARMAARNPSSRTANALKSNSPRSAWSRPARTSI